MRVSQNTTILDFLYLFYGEKEGGSLPLLSAAAAHTSRPEPLARCPAGAFFMRHRCNATVALHGKFCIIRRSAASARLRKDI